MRYSYHRGNTIVEYALMGGMIALASWAALFMLGHSIGGLTGDVNQGVASEQVKGLVSLEFGGGGASGGGAGGGNGSGASGGGNMAVTGGSGGTLRPVESGGNGQNVTSAEGNVVAVGSPTFKSTISSALQIKELADETGDPVVLHIAKILNWSGMAQATYEYQSGDKSPQLAEMKRISTQYQDVSEATLKESSLKSIGLRNLELDYQVNQLATSNLTADQKAMVISAAQQAVQKTRDAYGGSVLDEAAQNSINPLSTPTTEGGDELVGQMWDASKATLASGAADNHAAMKTTLQKGFETKAISER